MSKSGFDFKQYEKWVKQLGVAQKEFDFFLKQFLLEMAQRCIARTKQRTPVDTGALRNSWSIGNQKIELKETGGTSKSGKEAVTINEDKSDITSIVVIGNTMYVEIWNPMEYSSYVEYGHTLPNGKYLDGKFMLTISIDEIQKQIPARFDKAFKEFIKRYGV